MRYRELAVWQKAMDLAAACWALARRLPASEQEVAGAASRLRLSALAVPAGISETMTPSLPAAQSIAGVGADRLARAPSGVQAAFAGLRELRRQLTVAVHRCWLTEDEVRAALADADCVSRLLERVASEAMARDEFRAERARDARLPGRSGAGIAESRSAATDPPASRSIRLMI
jgi:hypothetical protein